MIEATLDRQPRLALYEYVRAERRTLVDIMLSDTDPSADQPTFASSLFFAGFLDRVCQALQRDEFLPLELWVKSLAADEAFDSRSSRLLSVACAIVADQFRNDVPGFPEVSTYLTLVAVELEVTFVNARLQRQGTPRIDVSKLVPVDQVVDALVTVIRSHSSALHDHARGVSSLAGRIASAMRQSPEQIVFVERCALLAGIGKVGIPETILFKPGPLSDEEWAVMRRYPATGASILRTMPALAMFSPVIRAHRERLDGRGYPDGTGHSDIPVQAKIIGVADAFHAMISDRPYRAPLPVPEALEELVRASGTQFDSDIVHTLRRLVAPSSEGTRFMERAAT